MKRYLPFAIMVLLLAAAVAGGLYLKRSTKNVELVLAGSPPQPGIAKTAEPAPAPAAEIPPALGADPPHARGPENAPVTLEAFADFPCQACGEVSALLKSIQGENRGHVRVIFRQFPMLNQHSHAATAARVAEAAGLQNKFWEMHDVLYKNRETWSQATDVVPIFEEYAQELGLDVERFKRHQTDASVRGRIALDLRRARTLGVKSTPVVYLNGAEIPSDQIKNIKGLRTVVSKALSRSVK